MQIPIINSLSVAVPNAFASKANFEISLSDSFAA